MNVEEASSFFFGHRDIKNTFMESPLKSDLKTVQKFGDFLPKKRLKNHFPTCKLYFFYTQTVSAKWVLHLPIDLQGAAVEVQHMDRCLKWST